MFTSYFRHKAFCHVPSCTYVLRNMRLISPLPPSCWLMCDCFCCLIIAGLELTKVPELLKSHGTYGWEYRPKTFAHHNCSPIPYVSKPYGVRQPAGNWLKKKSKIIGVWIWISDWSLSSHSTKLTIESNTEMNEMIQSASRTWAERVSFRTEYSMPFSCFETNNIVSRSLTSW